MIISEYNAQQHIENEKEISYRDGRAVCMNLTTISIDRSDFTVFER